MSAQKQSGLSRKAVRKKLMRYLRRAQRRYVLYRETKRPIDLSRALRSMMATAALAIDRKHQPWLLEKSGQAKIDDNDNPRFVTKLLAIAAEGSDRKSRYKYASTIKLALHKQIPAKGLADFMTKKGGLNGCTTRWTRSRK